METIKFGMILSLDLCITLPFISDGVGADASFQLPIQFVVDSNGFFYFVDSDSVRRMSPEYEVRTIIKVHGSCYAFAPLLK